MKVLQLIYTSCRKGLSSGAGFQTYSMSEGITDEERREIERYGLYIPPSNLPSQPSDEEIRRLFPVSYTFYRLESGRYAISRSTYLGKDYSGRYGNYFNHTLILQSGLWPMYPMQLYGSSVFKSRLSKAEEEIDKTPQPLAVLDTGDLLKNTSFTYDSVRKFVVEERLQYLQKMIAAVLSYENTHRPVILCDEYSHVPYWIGALTMSFSIKLAHNITFTTYAFDVERAGTLVSSTYREGGRFAFSESQKNYEYYIFDFVKKSESEITDKYKFNKLIEVGYSISEDSVVRFGDFIDRFDYNRLNAEIDAAFSLFGILGTGVSGLNNDEVSEAIEFANKYATPELLHSLSDGFGKIIEPLSSSVNSTTGKVIVNFLFKIARETKNKKHLDIGYSFFYSSLHHLVKRLPASCTDVDKAAIFNYFNDCLLMNKDYGKEFFDYLISPVRLKELVQMLSDAPAVHVEIYFMLTSLALLGIKHSWQEVSERKDLSQYLKASLNRLLESKELLYEALTTISADTEFFTQLVTNALHFAAGKASLNMNLLRCFSKSMKRKDGEWALKVRKYFIDIGEGSFVYDEYLLAFSEAEDREKSNLFWHYNDNIFAKYPNFAKSYFSGAVSRYLNSIDDRMKLQGCLRLIKYENQVSDASVLAEIVKVLEFEVSFPPNRSTGEIIVLLSKIKKQRRIVTSPDITTLVLLTLSMEEPAKNKFSLSDIFKPPLPELKGISVQQYKGYLDWALPLFIGLASSPKDHETIQGGLMAGEYEAVYISAYIDCLLSFLKRNKEEGFLIFESALGHFLSKLPGKDDKARSINRGNDDKTHFINNSIFEEKLIEALYGMNKSLLNRINEYINKDDKSKISKDSDLSKKWDKMLSEVRDRQEQSIFGRFKKLLNKRVI